MSQPNGIVRDMPNDKYHATPAIGSSGLKLLAQSPAHFYAAYLDPNRVSKEPTAAMKLGTATHTAILEPSEFDNRYTVMPDGLNRATKEGKAIWAAILETGKTPISQADIDRIMGMSAAVRAHPVSRLIFENNEPVFEMSMFWRDPVTGAPCKIRPDLAIMPCKAFPNGLIVDLKTTDDASPAGFGRNAWNWDMHLQAALYPEGFMHAVGTKKPPMFLWLAAEKENPFACMYHKATDELLKYGSHEVYLLRKLFAECLAANHWPAYPAEAQALQLPSWAIKTIQDTLTPATGAI